MPRNSSRQSELRGGLGVDRADDRFGQGLAFLDRLAFEHGDDLVGLLDAALGGEPARGLGHEDPHRDHQHGRDEADDEQRAPAVERDEEVAGEAGEQQADREDELVEQEEPAALLGADELVDVGAGHGDLAAGADALEEAEDQHGGAAPGEQAGDVHRDEQHDGDQQGGQAADLLGEPAEEDRADQLADVAGGEDEPDPGGGEAPFLHQRGHREGDDQHGVGVEEGGGADDDADQQQAAGDRDPLEAGYQLGVGGGCRAARAGV